MEIVGAIPGMAMVQMSKCDAGDLLTLGPIRNFLRSKFYICGIRSLASWIEYFGVMRQLHQQGAPKLCVSLFGTGGVPLIGRNLFMAETLEKGGIRNWSYPIRYSVLGVK